VSDEVERLGAPDLEAEPGATARRHAERIDPSRSYQSLRQRLVSTMS
jgi:hypothetical protein